MQGNTDQKNYENGPFPRSGYCFRIKSQFCLICNKMLNILSEMSTFWQAASISEVTCNLHVTATVSDNASANNNCCKMHSMLDGKTDANFASRIVHLCDPRIYVNHERIYMIMKTTLHFSFRCTML